MSSLSFAYKALVRVYMEDCYNPPRLCYEALYEDISTASFQYDGSEEMQFILDGHDWEKEGYFSVWVVGMFVWTTDYFGECDLEVEPDVFIIEEARQGDMETITGYECYTTPQLPRTAEGLFQFT